MSPPKDVDAYIAQAPNEYQSRLKKLRAAIRAAAPKAEESISYGMPTYKYKGRLVYFQLWKNHVGLYALSAPVLAAHRAELADCVQPKGTLRFPLDQELPFGLIKRLVKAQARQNEAADM